MKQTIWTCDRCNSTHVETHEVRVFDLPAGMYAFPLATRGHNHDHKGGRNDWLILENDETVADVCPNCQTAEDRANHLLREIEEFGQPDDDN
jgi:hypothetical protein